MERGSREREGGEGGREGGREEREGGREGGREGFQARVCHECSFNLIILCRVKHLYSEIQFIQDFAGSTLLQDKYGSLLTKFKDSFYQLLELKL